MASSPSKLIRIQIDQLNLDEKSRIFCFSLALAGDLCIIVFYSVSCNTLVQTQDKQTCLLVNLIAVLL